MDINGCKDSVLYLTISAPNPLTWENQPSKYGNYNISCFGANDGSFRPNVSNVLNPVYEWNGPNGYTSASKNISNLKPGIYTLTVIDTINGCTTIGKSDTIIEPPQLSVIIADSLYAGGFNIKCEGENNGKATAIVSGGHNSNIKYIWKKKDSSEILNGSYRQIALGTGTYFLDVEDHYIFL
ncbi:MAG: hypothetical protein HC905_12005 [Bacteroidales bacterium]|nr:hypothetical protein [Bacteroidales bacterium]